MSNSDIYDRTFEFACEIVRLCQNLEGQRAVNRSLISQLLRSGTSIGANLAEGRGAESRADFIHKVTLCAKEAHETYYWLRLIVACGIADRVELEGLLDEANQIISILTSIARNAKRNAEL